MMLELGVELGEMLAAEQPQAGRRLPYDAAHKFAARHPAVARSLLEDCLAAPWVAGLAWERMELVSTEHLSRTLRRSVSDLVRRIGRRAPGQPDLHVLVEFQARDDWTMALRMDNYAGQLLGGLVDTGAPGPALPPVQGLVVYHGGRGGWDAAVVAGEPAGDAPAAGRGGRPAAEPVRGAVPAAGTRGRSEGLEEGLERGREEGREGYLLYLVRERFGEAVQRSVSAALAAGAVRGSVEEVGQWLLTSPSAEAFLARVGAA